MQGARQKISDRPPGVALQMPSQSLFQFGVPLLRMRSGIDILPALKDGDSLYRTAMPDRKNVLGRIDVAVVSDTTLTASPFSYSQT